MNVLVRRKALPIADAIRSHSRLTPAAGLAASVSGPFAVANDAEAGPMAGGSSAAPRQPPDRAIRRPNAEATCLKVAEILSHSRAGSRLNDIDP